MPRNNLTYVKVFLVYQLFLIYNGDRFNVNHSY